MNKTNFVPQISTYIFNNLQLGLIYVVIKHDLSLETAFIFYFVFELAILFDCLLKFGSQIQWGVTLLFSCVLYFLFFPTEFADLGISSKMGLYISLFLCVLSLKKIRTLNKAVGKVKKVWRAVGYLTCFIFSPETLLFFSALIFFNTLILSDNLKEAPKIILPDVSREFIIPYSGVMFHHFHYFSYAYLVPVIIFSISSIPIPFLGVVFYVGWAGYYLLENVSKYKYYIAAIGHIVSGIAVFLLIPFEGNLIAVLFLWFLTAIGAGSIVVMRDVFTKKKPHTYDQFKTWESFGHLLGIIVMGISIWLDDFGISFIFGGVAGIVCAFLVLSLLKTTPE